VFPGLEAESRRVKSCMVESAAMSGFQGFRGSGVQGLGQLRSEVQVLKALAF